MIGPSGDAVAGVAAALTPGCSARRSCSEATASRRGEERPNGAATSCNHASKLCEPRCGAGATAAAAAAAQQQQPYAALTPCHWLAGARGGAPSRHQGPPAARCFLSRCVDAGGARGVVAQLITNAVTHRAGGCAFGAARCRRSDWRHNSIGLRRSAAQPLRNRARYSSAVLGLQLSGDGGLEAS